MRLFCSSKLRSRHFAHLPLLLKPDGNGKLSKRDGDRLGFPVFPLEFHNQKDGTVSSGYRESGYLPEAVINFLALLGWHAASDQEIFSMQELIEQFSLDRVSKSGAGNPPAKEIICGSAAACRIAPTASVPSAGTRFENLNCVIVVTPQNLIF